MIDPLGLNRARRTDASPQVTIDGSGFSPTPAQNQVFMGGSLASIVAESATQITFDFPLPFSADVFDLRSIHVPIAVVNLDTGERSTEAWVWIPADLDEVADERIDEAIPGPSEVTSAPEVPRRFEARDMQRLAALIESLTVDVQAGNVLSHDGTKIAEPAGLKGSGGGQVLTVDLAEPTDLIWGFRCDAWLRFGGIVPVALPGNQLLIAAGNASFDASFSFFGKENWALDDGTLDLISLRGISTGGTLLDRIEVLVAGVSVFDSGAGLGTVDYSAVLALSVTAGDKVEVRAYVAGGVTTWSGVGGIRQLVD